LKTKIFSLDFENKGRCYDHNFLRFLPIFGEQIGVFFKNQCYDQNFALFSFVSSQKRHFFRRKYFKNHNIGPRSSLLQRWHCSCKLRIRKIGFRLVSYNDSAVKIYNATISFAHFNNIFFSSTLKNALAYSTKFRCRRIGSRTQPNDRELERQRCKKLQRHKYVD
jgi:hypothetical protein